MIEKIAYAGLPNCYRAYNEEIELIASSDTGPRVLHFGFVGEWNEFVPAQKTRLFRPPSLACPRSVSAFLHFGRPARRIYGA